MRILDWIHSIWSAVTQPMRRRSLYRFGAERLEPRMLLSAAYFVDSFEDGTDANPGDGIAETADGRTTLRAAIQEANTDPDPDLIFLPGGEYSLTLLEPTDDAGAAGSNGPATADAGDLGLDGFLAVVGFGADLTRIDATALSAGTDGDPVFSLNAESFFVLSGVTLVTSAGAPAITAQESSIALLVDVAVEQTDGDGSVASIYSLIDVVIGPGELTIGQPAEEPVDPINTIPAPIIHSGDTHQPSAELNGRIYREWASSPSTGHPLDTITTPVIITSHAGGVLDAMLGIHNPSPFTQPSVAEATQIPTTIGEAAGEAGSATVQTTVTAGGVEQVSAEEEAAEQAASPDQRAADDADTRDSDAAANNTQQPLTIHEAGHDARPMAPPRPMPRRLTPPLSAEPADGASDKATNDSEDGQAMSRTAQRRRDVVRSLFRHRAQQTHSV